METKKIKLTINLNEFFYRSLYVTDDTYEVSLNEVMEVNKIWIKKPKNLNVFSFMLVHSPRTLITFIDGSVDGNVITFYDKNKKKKLIVRHETEEEKESRILA
jgi:hypothetical protein